MLPPDVVLGERLLASSALLDSKPFTKLTVMILTGLILLVGTCVLIFGRSFYPNTWASCATMWISLCPRWLYIQEILCSYSSPVDIILELS